MIQIKVLKGHKMVQRRVRNIKVCPIRIRKNMGLILSSQQTELNDKNIFIIIFKF